MNPLGSAQLAAAGSRNSQTGNRAQGAVFAVASVKVHIFRVLVHAYPDTDGLTVTIPSMTFRLPKSAEFQVPLQSHLHRLTGLNPSYTTLHPRLGGVNHGTVVYTVVWRNSVV